MARSEERDALSVRSGDPAVEAGQLPDERQFIGAVQRVDGGWMAVVHFFSAEGDHLDTEHSAIFEHGGSEPPKALKDELERMLRLLDPYRADAVTVVPFEIEVAGRTIGLARADGSGVRLRPSGPELEAATDD